MLTGKELGAAIESARIAKGVSKKKLAEDFGVKPPSVQGWVNTGRIDKAKLMELIAYFSDVVAIEHWGISSQACDAFLCLADRTQHHPALEPTQQDRDTQHKESNVHAVDFSRYRATRAGEILIPQYDVRASMGAGQELPSSYIDTIRHIAVSPDYLREAGVQYTAARNLAVITGFGESMHKTFSSGDPLIIDRGVNELITDGVYLFTLAGMLYIKRLQLLPGKVRMISDNDAFPPYDIQGSELGELIIHARVLLAWNARKL